MYSGLSLPRCLQHTMYLFIPSIGLPKPAVLDQSKAIMTRSWLMQFDHRPDDIMYVATPLYHALAAAAGLFSAIGRGKMTFIVVISFEHN